MLSNVGVPLQYDHANIYSSQFNPSTMHAADTGLTWFFQRYLFQRALSVFKWKVPKTWELNYMLYCLYIFGFFAVIRTNKFGVIPQGCSIKGYNVMYSPTNAVIANPLLKGILEPRIGRECEIIKLQPDWCGIWDLVSFYAEMMSMTASTAGSNIMASKLAYLFVAKDKSFADSFKKLVDNILSGEPIVIANKNIADADGKLNIQMFSNSLKSNYIATQLLEDLESWERRFDTEIGIPRTNTQKRERLVSGEINATMPQSFSRADMWLDSLKDGIEKTKAMFDIDLSVEWRINPYEMGDANVQESSYQPTSTKRMG